MFRSWHFGVGMLVFCQLLLRRAYFVFVYLVAHLGWFIWDGLSWSATSPCADPLLFGLRYAPRRHIVLESLALRHTLVWQV